LKRRYAFAVLLGIAAVLLIVLRFGYGDGIRRLFHPVAHSANLQWVASTSPVAGYNIYRATQPGGPYSRVNLKVQPGTTYLDTTVQAGVSYYYVVVAVADSGMESRYSNEVVGAIPWP